MESAFAWVPRGQASSAVTGGGLECQSKLPREKPQRNASPVAYAVRGAKTPVFPLPVESRDGTGPTGPGELCSHGGLKCQSKLREKSLRCATSPAAYAQCTGAKTLFSPSRWNRGTVRVPRAQASLQSRAVARNASPKLPRKSPHAPPAQPLMRSARKKHDFPLSGGIAGRYGSHGAQASLQSRAGLNASLSSERKPCSRNASPAAARQKKKRCEKHRFFPFRWNRGTARVPRGPASSAATGCRIGAQRVPLGSYRGMGEGVGTIGL